MAVDSADETCRELHSPCCRRGGPQLRVERGAWPARPRGAIGLGCRQWSGPAQSEVPQRQGETPASVGLLWRPTSMLGRPWSITGLGGVTVVRPWAGAT